MKDMKIRLSMLWVFAMFNYVYADVMTLIDPTSQPDLRAGQVGTLQVTQGFLFAAAVLMETAIAMILLSRTLPNKANRWANIIIGILHTVSVAASLFVGGSTPAMYYLFFATVEIACTLLIVWFAWTWKDTGELSVA